MFHWCVKTVGEASQRLPGTALLHYDGRWLGDTGYFLKSALKHLYGWLGFAKIFSLKGKHPRVKQSHFSIRACPKCSEQ